MRPEKTRRQKNYRHTRSTLRLTKQKNTSKSTSHISGSSTYLMFPKYFMHKRIMNNYFHLIEDGLVYILTYMHIHKLNKENTYMYLNPEFFIEKHSKRMVFTVLGNFIQVRTTLPRNKTPKVISKKYLDYSILLSKLESLLSPPKKLSNIVYVVRKGVRYVLNDKEIIEALKIKYKGKYNVIVVDFSEKSFQEQIDIMNGCILFIGCHGAGFTNVYFMAQNTNMLEFFPESFYAYCYVYICIRKHIKHYFLHGKSTVTPPITLDTYLKKRYLPEYNTVDFRRSIKNMTFSMNCAQVIKKVSEILD